MLKLDLILYAQYFWNGTLFMCLIISVKCLCQRNRVSTKYSNRIGKRQGIVMVLLHKASFNTLISLSQRRGPKRKRGLFLLDTSSRLLAQLRRAQELGSVAATDLAEVSTGKGINNIKNNNYASRSGLTLEEHGIGGWRHRMIVQVLQ